MPPFQSPQTMIREDFVRIVLAGLLSSSVSDVLSSYSYPVPPAQIPASGTTAPGSYLELWRTKKRSSGQGCRTLGCGSQRVTWRCIFFQVSFRL